jgi:hypothetical protein
MCSSILTALVGTFYFDSGAKIDTDIKPTLFLGVKKFVKRYCLTYPNFILVYIILVSS